MRRRVEKLADGPVLDRLAARPGQGGTAPDDNLNADLDDGRLSRDQAEDNQAWGDQAGDNQAGEDQRWGNQPWNHQYRDERDRPARGIMLGMAIGAAAWVLIGLAVLTWWS